MNKSRMTFFAACVGGFLYGASLLVSIKVIFAATFLILLMVLLQRRLKELFYLYLFCVFFIPPTIGIDTPFLLLNVDRMILALLLGSWGFALVNGKKRIARTPLDREIIFYMVTILISVLVNISTISSRGLIFGSSVKIFALFFERILLIYLLPSIITDKKEIRNILIFSVLCLSVVAAYGIVESKTHYNIFTKFTMIDRSGVNKTVLSEALREGKYRAKSTQMLPHVFGTDLCMFFPLLLYAFMTTRGLLRVSVGGLALLFLGGIAVTYTRGVYLALCLGAFISFFLFKSPLKKIILLFLVVCVLCLASTRPSVRDFYSRYLSRLMNQKLATYDRDNSIQARLSDYGYAAMQLKERPLFGSGLGTHIAGISGAPYLDNTYLYVLIETGLLGFVGFVLLLNGVLFRLGRKIRERLAGDPDALWMCFLHVALVIFYFQCATYDAFGLGGASKLFWVIMGILIAYLHFTSSRSDASVHNHRKL